MGAKIFVGNVSPRTTRSQLTQFFSAAGRVESVIVPVDRQTGDPRGFCFVEFADSEAASAAIALCSDQKLEGRVLRPSWARERDGGSEERNGRRPQAPAGRNGRNGNNDSDELVRILESSWSGESSERRGEKSRRHGKHGSDRRRRSGTRREID